MDVVRGTTSLEGVVSLQIKSGKSYFHEGRWVLPGEPEDFLWRERPVPFFGVVHEPGSGALRFVPGEGSARRCTSR